MDAKIEYHRTDPDTVANIFGAADLNNAANKLERSGDYLGAERKHLQALAMKIKATNENSTGVALTKNALGELYMKMNRLDEAQAMLEAAAAIRGPDRNFDSACTWDNLGRLWEMRGDLTKAREARKQGSPNLMICSNFNCPLSKICTIYQSTNLKTCGKCKCVFYCCTACQKIDWKARHKRYCKIVEST
ncbi:hypothetical protein B0O99DRAFT_627390 [Bisporella sp. PMI_857]|nr:hypothetical protein B0O99DRAFT_627390 [Bisporella sp. PMI_857]